MKLILLRHGESRWNLENRFTGWKDVDLTKNGIIEAEFAGKKILKEKIEVESIYTSILKRANHTAHIVSNIINFDKENIQYDWRLNERHYGALQGLNKSETASQFGEEQVQIWRRSFDTPPPFLDEQDKRHPKFNDKFNQINSKDLPSGESLKMVIKRLTPFWNQYFNFIRFDKSHLIVAHSNSLRAIVKILDKLSETEIMAVNIPTGVPLVYTFDKGKNVTKKEYLIDSKELQHKQELVAKQGKAQ
tara:strand:+ start:107 stop:847 length:741 start_codon:yes stop_codon:yes gene_type:complete